MRIRCIANTGASLPESYIDPALGYKKETEFPLTIGKEYTVYALKEWQGSVWYYICDDHDMYYPMQNPAPLFEIIDNRMGSMSPLQVDEPPSSPSPFSQFWEKGSKSSRVPLPSLGEGFRVRADKGDMLPQNVSILDVSALS